MSSLAVQSHYTGHFIGQQVMKFVCIYFHIIDIFLTYTVTFIFQSLQANISRYCIIQCDLHLGKYILMLFSVSFRYFLTGIVVNVFATQDKHIPLQV